jgi:hypothetical protein
MSKAETQALQTVHQKLSQAAEFYIAGDLEQKRQAVCASLLAVIEYFEQKNFDPHLLLPILRPAQALAGLQTNALDQLFAERPKKQKPKHTMENYWRIAIVAAFANVWLEAHSDQTQKQADKLSRAARKMQGRFFQDVDAAQLKTARDLVSQSPKESIVVEFYAGFRAFFDKLTEMHGPIDAFALMARYINNHELSLSEGIFKTPPVSPRRKT